MKGSRLNCNGLFEYWYGYIKRIRDDSLARFEKKMAQLKVTQVKQGMIVLVIRAAEEVIKSKGEVDEKL